MATLFSRRFRFVRIACMVLAGATPAHADEIWVAPTSQADFGGLEVASNVIWPVTPIGVVRLAWAIPGDLQTFQSAKIALIPSSPGGASTLNVMVSPAQNGNAVAAGCAGPFTQGFTGVANQLVEVEIGALISSRIGTPGANYLAVLAFTTPTTTTDHIVGLRFSYAPKTPTGVATLAANTFTGPQTAPQFSGSFVGNGAGLTNLPAGSTNYIQNTSATQAGANFNIGGNGVVGGNLTVTGTLNGPLAITGPQDTVLTVTGSGNHGIGVVATALDIGVYGTGASGVQGYSDGGYGVLGTIGSNGLTGVYGIGTASSFDSRGYAGYFQGRSYFSDAVGIGTYALATPTTMLQVEGASLQGIYAHSVSGYALHTRSEQTHAAVFEGTTWFTRRIRVDELGAPNTSTQLCWNTSHEVSSCSSSLRYKTNVQSFLGGLNVVQQLRPISFTWKQGGLPDVGLAAEEVNQVEPLLTFRNDHGEIEGVKYNQLAVVFINAIQEQQAESRQQREQVASQQRQIDALEQRLNELLSRRPTPQP